MAVVVSEELAEAMKGAFPLMVSSMVMTVMIPVTVARGPSRDATSEVVGKEVATGSQQPTGWTLATS